jgi:hypothetical protein
MRNTTGIRPSWIPSLIVGMMTLLAGSAFAASPPDLSIAKANASSAVSESSGVPSASLTRIAFAAGTTSGTYTGSLASGGTQSYVLWAGYDQVMIVKADTPDGKTYLEIYNYSTGNHLCNLSSALTSWQGWLPRTGDYIVNVYNSGGSAQSYSLFVEIPARIHFARGAYSKSVWGKGSAAQILSYVLWARANQTMTASLSSSTGTVYLNIYSFNSGQSLVASSSSQTSWSGTLPQSGDYIIDSVQGGTWVDFTLTVTIV